MLFRSRPTIAPTMPEPVSVVNGEPVSWSRVAFAGGSHVLSGSALFQTYQGFYDPRVAWSRDWVRVYNPIYWVATPANTYMSYARAYVPTRGQLVTSGVVVADVLAGARSEERRVGKEC